MTRQELINAIEKECQKCNPSLLKLEMGCRVKFDNQIGIFCGGDEICVQKVILLPNGYCHDTCQEVEILGKEPGLAEIFMILKQIPGGLLVADNWGVEVGNYDVAKLLKLWDLTKGLYGQTDECLTFLYSLLFTK